MKKVYLYELTFLIILLVISLIGHYFLSWIHVLPVSLLCGSKDKSTLDLTP